MATVEALNVEDITKVGVIVTIALVVIGLLLSILITAIVGRIIVAVVVIVLAVFVWQQRSHVEDKINKNDCDLSATYFGFHLDAPDSVKQACADQTQKS
jgi:hypothetical protein